MNIFTKVKQKWVGLNAYEKTSLLCKYVLPPVSAVLTMAGVILILMALGWTWTSSGFCAPAGWM